jgi:hypothetical protein
MSSTSFSISVRMGIPVGAIVVVPVRFSRYGGLAQWRELRPRAVGRMSRPAGIGSG